MASGLRRTDLDFASLVCSDLIGWVNTVRYTLLEWAGKPVAYKPATFYLELVSLLPRPMRRVQLTDRVLSVPQADYLAKVGH